MATPDRVKLVCPLCGNAFRAKTMGSSYYIAGVDTDLRETGSIDEVRRFSIASCQVCRYSDYSWDFLAPDELTDEVRGQLEQVLAVDSKNPGRALNRTIGDFERLRLASECFAARGLDRSSLAELKLLSYYVANDLGRRDLIPELRDAAATLFAEVLQEEDLPGPLRQRYAYLAGELTRRAGDSTQAEGYFDQAITAGQEDEEDGDPEGNAWDIARMARRMRAAVQHQDAPPEQLLELIRGDDPDVAAEASRMLASRRDEASVAAIHEVWDAASDRDQTEMLRELIDAPSPGCTDLFLEGLESPSPEDIRLAARGLGALADPSAADALLAALERGILSTEATLVEALRRLGAPGTFERVAKILEGWEARDAEAEDDDWYFSSDTTPLKHLLYTSGEDYGRELMIRDMSRLQENDLWDKIPSGGPVSAALSRPEVGDALRGLLGDENPATRRWAAYCLADLNQTDALEDIKKLVEDADQVVRLQAAAGLARLGDLSQESVVLSELQSLDDADLPFALHFLVPFKSEAVKTYLLSLLETGKASRSEVLPLLGRQEPDDRVAELLATALLETDDETRAGAVTGLAFQGGETAPLRLRLLYDQEDSDEVQRRVIFGLGRLAKLGHHREETVAFLRERLERANPRLRFSVALTLLQLGDTSGIDIVRERAALFDESLDRYDLVAPALKALAAHGA